MQSAINAGTDNDTTLVTAEILRGMTVSKEALAERQKASVLDQLMSSMVRIATEQGGNQYAANLNPQFDPTLLAQITEELTKLGYTTTTEAKNDPKLGSFIQVVVTW